MSTTNEKTKTEPMVRLYNRGSGAYTHGPHRINGGSFATVPESTAKVWLSMFPDKIITANDAESSGESTRRDLQVANAKLQAADRRIVDLEQELQRLTAKKTPASPGPAHKLTPGPLG
jgi:hypothetical protein